MPNVDEALPDTMRLMAFGPGLPDEGLLLLEQFASSVHVINPNTLPKDHPEILGMLTSYYPGVNVDVKFEREGDMVNVYKMEGEDSEEFSCATARWEKVTSFSLPSSKSLQLKHGAEMYDYAVSLCSHLTGGEGGI